MSQKVHHTFKIVGLAILTLGLAAFITFIFPKWSILQKAIQQPTTPIIVTPESTPRIVTFDTLRPNDRVRSGSIITGTVPGRWFFEASFPVQLKNANGITFQTLAATTTEDWMTTENVNFTITLPDHFDYTGIGTLYLSKDDPSGGEAPFNPTTDEFSIPLIFENE